MPNFCTLYGYVKKTGDTMTGDLAMSSHKVTGLAAAAGAGEAARYEQLESEVHQRVSIAGDVMTGNLQMAVGSDLDLGVGSNILIAAAGLVDGVDVSELRYHDYVAKASDTIYLAAEDGLVEAGRVVGAGVNALFGYTDGSNPPTTLIQGHQMESNDSLGSRLSFTMTVKKGDYWKVTNCNYVFWRPHA